MIKQVTKQCKKPTIQAPAVFRCYEKGTRRVLGYVVPSDEGGHDPYHVIYNHALHRYECDCLCGQKYMHRVECKHIKAVLEVVAARRELIARGEHLLEVLSLGSVVLRTAPEEVRNPLASLPPDKRREMYNVLYDPNYVDSLAA